MSFSNIYKIAGSAMNAQNVRLNSVASNLANADSAAASEEEAYKAKRPIFSAYYQNSLNHAEQGASVKVVDVVDVAGSVRRYEPKHPLADKKGYVFYPDVNVVEEMADMMSASRSFETNTEILSSVKSMQLSLLKLGETR